MPVSKILELHSRNGRSLVEIGLNEAALPLAAAKAALDLFALERWCVLGGDVYQFTEDDRFESIYEDWFYEGENVDESVDVARNFISSLGFRPVYIVFVLASR